jgi:hypothetical protein
VRHAFAPLYLQIVHKGMISGFVESENSFGGDRPMSLRSSEAVGARGSSRPAPLEPVQWPGIAKPASGTVGSLRRKQGKTIRVCRY